MSGLSPEEYRALMGSWVTGVAVVTTSGPAGATVNSVTSLSLHPPRLLVCLATGSRMARAVAETGRFCLNMLAEGQEELSARFAGPRSPDDRFAGVPYSLVDGVPVLDGCVATVVCEVAQQIPADDHVIAVGRPVRSDVDPNRSPLAYFRREYHRGVPTGPTALTG